MTIAFTRNETFRDDFTFRNSAAAIRRFPFPFVEDEFMYSVNIEPHVSVGTGCYQHAIDVDEHYVAECREREICLATTADRYLALPHMMPAQWDCLELIMQNLARDYPEYFQLTREGTRWHWVNLPLAIENPTLFARRGPLHVLDFMARLHARTDAPLIVDRDDDRVLDQGVGGLGHGCTVTPRRGCGPPGRPGSSR